MTFSDEGLIAAAVLLTPLMLTIAWIDLRHMIIPNWSVLAVAGVFLAVGVWSLPLETFLWRIGYGLLTLLVAAVFYEVFLAAVGASPVGAGDLKLIAALVPFLGLFDVVSYIQVLILLAMAMVLVYLVRLIRRGEFGFRTFLKTAVPYGVVLGLAMVIQLCLEAYGRFAA